MKKILKDTLILMIILVITIFHVNISEALENENIDYTETLENFENPERGFYKPLNIRLSPSGNKAGVPTAKLTHLRVGIGNFSGVVNGEQDMELTQDALNSLNETLANAKKNDCSVIIRFAYDSYFEGKANCEPSMDMILKHISQLKPVFEENQDVISYIELGFFGPWGEMHTSSMCTTDNVSKALDAMLDSAPEKIKIGVRTPNYYAKWLGINRADLDKNVTEKGTRAYRVGLYNDGYLGSGNDLGTFANREIEITWLEKQAMHTLYGGEVVTNANPSNLPALNTAAYMSQEAFRTHTTYLNAEWNYTVIASWKNEIYNGEDPLYAGQTGYTYIANHLGYRFVLRKSEIIDSVKQGEKLNLKLNIENVGFANLINSKVVSLVFTKGDERYEVKTDIDATQWNSNEITNLDFETDLPENISLGEWSVYLRLSQYGDMDTDDNYQCIRLANNGNMWNEEIGANYIGRFAVLEKDDEDNEGDNTEEPDGKEDNTPGGDNTEDPDGKEDNTPGGDNTEEPDDKEDNTLRDDNTDKKNDAKKVEDSLKDNTFSSKNLPYTGGTTKFIMIIQLFIVISILLSIHFYERMKKVNNIDISEKDIE